jgi:hypothetical protein
MLCQCAIKSAWKLKLLLININMANVHGIANCFRIFNEQNELPDPKKVIYKVNSKFKNLATKTKKKFCHVRDLNPGLVTSAINDSLPIIHVNR